MARKTAQTTSKNKPATASTETSAEVTTQAGEQSLAEVATTSPANVENTVTEPITPPAGEVVAESGDVSVKSEGGESTPPETSAQEDHQAASGDQVTPGLLFEITSIPDRGFWRAGRKWTPEAQTVSRDEFTDDQWAALQAESNIKITAKG